MERLPEKTSLGELANKDLVLARQYAECRERVRGWIEWEQGRPSERTGR